MYTHLIQLSTVFLAPYAIATVSSPESHKSDLTPFRVRQRRDKGDVICEPFGSCGRCPDAEMQQPFCQPFGNRRLLHCRNPDTDLRGEIPAWISCGRIIAQEKADFFEFMACNMAFAVVGLLVLFWRSRQMAYKRSRTLAARIGVTRTPPGAP
ncbi:hypothetical protein JB92DRAFT_2728158 [Gautieria morchelliformis]|nr:hypothetical protein JB92DRAFT_2728158 [Gautieria morchelliformis]